MSTQQLHGQLRYRMFFLYFDAIAYHLSLEFPKLVTKRSEAYVSMVMLPLILLAELGNGVIMKRPWMRIAPTLAITAFVIYRFHTLIRQSLTRAKAWADNRLDANTSALKTLAEGIQKGRIRVEPGFFDLFLPPGVAATSHNTARTVVKAGLILFPGALVEYRAYAGVAKKLADEGVLVVLFNTERFHRLPVEIFECNMNNVQKAISMLHSKFKLQCQEWSIGGHSMGAFTSQQIVLENPTFFRCIVLFATYRPLMIEDSDIDVLVVQATCDGIGESFRKAPHRQQFLDSFAKLRRRKRLHDIEGGNHGGFGDYATQTFPVPDRERSIPLEAMHDEIVKVTADFLLGRNDDS